MGARWMGATYPIAALADNAPMRYVAPVWNSSFARPSGRRRFSAILLPINEGMHNAEHKT
jgi:hypothetical protein